MEDLNREIRFAVWMSIVLDVLIWLVSLAFAGLTPGVPLGLLCGTGAMLCNLLLLRRMVRMAVYSGRTHSFGGYLLRCLIASAAIAAGLCFEMINAAAVILPFLYQRLIFAVLAWRIKKEV